MLLGRIATLLPREIPHFASRPIAPQNACAVGFGRTYDCGSKIGFLAANLAYALDRDDLRSALLDEINTLVPKR